MEFTEITDPVGEAAEREPAVGEQCEECGAPLDRLQRYCVSCGARHLSVPDPAAAYLAQASARARVRTRAASASGRNSAGSRTRVSSTTALLALVAVLVAIGVGVLIGHGTGGGNDSAQLKALSQQVAKLQAGGTAGTSGSTTGAGTTAGGGNSGGGTSGGAKASTTSGVDNATGKAYLQKALHSSGSSVTVP